MFGKRVLTTLAFLALFVTGLSLGLTVAGARESLTRSITTAQQGVGLLDKALADARAKK